jgi:hypothetical protein
MPRFSHALRSIVAICAYYLVNPRDSKGCADASRERPSIICVKLGGFVKMDGAIALRVLSMNIRARLFEVTSAASELA